MKAISVMQPYAALIAAGLKGIEFRAWQTDYRGPLLIVASQKIDPEEYELLGLHPKDLVRGSAVCVVDLVAINGSPGEYEWAIEQPRAVEPRSVVVHPVARMLHLYDVDDSMIEYTARAFPWRADAWPELATKRLRKTG